MFVAGEDADVPVDGECRDGGVFFFSPVIRAKSSNPESSESTVILMRRKPSF